MIFFHSYQDQFATNKDAAQYLKKFLDAKYYWLEWFVIAYTDKKGSSANNTESAHYVIDGFHKGRRGK